MKPSDKYENILKQSEYVSDDAQKKSIAMLDSLHNLLILRETKSVPAWWRKFLFPNKTVNPVKGIYFWGGVGRGKTFLMDIFYQCLPIDKKKRSHFHQFMNEIHHALKHIGNIENPLDRVARNLGREFSVLCLDEFVITDIGDAMIMAGLLKALFEQGVVLITTSNSPPQDLYYDGLQRDRFLPAIELIIQYCEVTCLDGGQDYRLKGLGQTHLYTIPHSQAVLDQIECYLTEHVTPYQALLQKLTINDRELSCNFCAEDTVWFSFDQLCKTNRSQNDYLELARLFNTLILTDINEMSSLNDDVARRFVLLIDVLYDHHVIFICSASVKPGKLYGGKRLAFEFERTSSRLIEMQSQQYLAQAHTLQ